MEIVKATKLRKAAETITIMLLAAIASAFLPAHAQQKGKIGDLVTFKDGSKGVLVQVDRSGESGWAVALQDAGTAKWAENQEDDTKALNKTALERRWSLNDIHELLADTAGYAATKAIREAANEDHNKYPAAFVVDFKNGWFLPTAGQMFSLFAMEPFIKKTIVDNGGKLPEGDYWTSTPKDKRTAWFLACQLGIFDDNDGFKMEKEHFVRAMHRWQADKNVETFTLTFDGNGATEGSMQSMSVEVGHSITLLTNTFKRDGYEFLGWSETQGAAAPAYTDGQTGVALAGKSNETITLYAVWKNKLQATFTLAFDGNGATEGTMQSRSVAVGESITLPTNTFKRDGYEFLGWSETQGAAAPAYTDGQADVALPGKSNETITLYAVWKEQLQTTFTLTFDGNGATEGTMQSKSVAVGASITLPANTFKREGYEFLGWSRVQGAAAPAYTDGQDGVALAGKSNETITLYAVWKKKLQATFTIAFDGSGATEGSMQSMSVAVGDSITLPTNTFKREGYEFLGWSRVQGAAAPAYTDGQDGVALAGKSNETITLYAVWKKLPSTAVESLALASAQIVSNPFEERLTIVGTETAIRVEVYSILGTQLYSASLHGEEKLEIATGEWSSGVYLIKLEATDGIRLIRAVKR